MHEASKAVARRGADRRYITQWLRGDGIDIGAGDDSLARLKRFFPLITKVVSWDVDNGDAMHMHGVPDNAFDFVHSSHCLEHLLDPVEALRNWIRITKPGGCLVITVPDEDMYEQGVFPSTYNPDHKWTFTVMKMPGRSWSSRSVNVVDLLARAAGEVELVRLDLLDGGFVAEIDRQDQTLGPLAESAIEFILRKRSEACGSTGGHASG